VIPASSRKGGGLGDAPGRGLVGAEGDYATRAASFPFHRSSKKRRSGANHPHHRERRTPLP